MFQDLERQLGLAIPNDVKQYFHLINPYLHQQEHPLFYGLIALPLDIALAEREEFSRSGSVFMAPDFAPVDSVDPPGTIRPVAFDAGWLPLARDYGGAYLAVDLRPDARGQVGQIINFGAREWKRFVLAPSITAFFADLLQNVADGRATQECEAGTVDVRLNHPDMDDLFFLCAQFGASALRHGWPDTLRPTRP
ncbi:SMI1/KNR4 family protein [Deinococcus soli (ex Cha et al. 2016)]|uniref:SMI1/KNR4 family protein n=1 Tax=Deinococcus soli (ex Cha et al. 2016) TaxID=1309411 RepID=UPI001E52EA67